MPVVFWCLWHVVRLLTVLISIWDQSGSWWIIHSCKPAATFKRALTLSTYLSLEGELWMGICLQNSVDFFYLEGFIAAFLLK